MEFKFEKNELPLTLLAPPKGFCPESDESEALFGVEKPENAPVLAPLPPNKLGLLFPFPPKEEFDCPVLPAPANKEGCEVAEVVAVLPKRLGAEEVVAVLAEPNNDLEVLVLLKGLDPKTLFDELGLLA